VSAEQPVSIVPSNRNDSLVNRLIRSAALWVIPTLLFASVVLIWLYRSSTYRIFDESLEAVVTYLIAASEMDTSGERVSLSAEPLDPRYQRALSGQYWIIGSIGDDGQLRPIQASRSLSEETLTLPDVDAIKLLTNPGLQLASYMDGPDENEPLRAVARSIIFAPMNERPIVVVAAADLRPTSRAIRNFAIYAFGLLALLSGGLLFALFKQVSIGLKPLFDLRDSVADVREGIQAKVIGEYPAEIQPLANELNSLIQHNKDVVERARTHVGNLAHALKTPLAVLKNEADSEKRISSDVVTRQSDIMKNQVDHHLQRARAAARGQVIGVSTPVNEVIDPLARTLPRIYREKDLSIDINVSENLMFRGEKRDLDELIGNLMDNGCKWSTSRVRVTGGVDNNETGMIWLSVEDDGPGLKSHEYKLALKRGIRLDEATPGTGFGLSIVSDLARAYKGNLILGRSTLGGLEATLHLPGRQ